jgi:hypothetical protein
MTKDDFEKILKEKLVDSEQVEDLKNYVGQYLNEIVQTVIEEPEDDSSLGFMITAFNRFLSKLGMGDLSVQSMEMIKRGLVNLPYERLTDIH